MRSFFFDLLLKQGQHHWREIKTVKADILHTLLTCQAVEHFCDRSGAAARIQNIHPRVNEIVLREGGLQHLFLLKKTHEEALVLLRSLVVKRLNALDCHPLFPNYRV